MTLLKRFCCAVFPALVACGAPPSTQSFCTPQTCLPLSGATTDQHLVLRGHGVKRADAGNQNTPVVFTTEWRGFEGSQDPGVFSLTATPRAEASAPETVLREGGGVDGYTYEARTDLGGYDFVQAFRVRAGADMNSPVVYDGYHGFVPTALLATTGRAAYFGEAFGEIAYTPFTGDTNGEVNRVDVSGGTVRTVADFSAGTVGLTLTFVNIVQAVRKTLEIRYTGLPIQYSWDFTSQLMAPTLTVTADQGSATDFDASTSSAFGTFYGWNGDRSLPAEVGGSVNLRGTSDANTFANLLFLGKSASGLGDTITPCTGASACSPLSTRAESIDIIGGAVNPMDQSTYRTVATWRPIAVDGAGIRSIVGNPTMPSTPPPPQTFLDLDANPPNGNTYNALQGDFDNQDMVNTVTEMTNGYEFVRAYDVRNSGGTELYRGFHGIPFAGPLPTSGSATYSGHVLINDGMGWLGRQVNNFFRINFGSETQIAFDIPNTSIPADRAHEFSGTGIVFQIAVANDPGSGTFIGTSKISFTNSTPPPNFVFYDYHAVVGLYGFDANAGGQGIGGPDEVGGVVTFTEDNQEEDPKRLTVLFVGD